MSLCSQSVLHSIKQTYLLLQSTIYFARLTENKQQLGKTVTRKGGSF
jgi:hypothetical protein